MTCSHPHTIITWAERDGKQVAFARNCATCDARMSLGPSNDNDPNVQEEMQVAEEIAATAVNLGSESNAWCEDGTVILCSGLWLDAFNDSLWPWDPSRPIAGQYEQHPAHMTRGDAMLDEVIAHDPTGSSSDYQASADEGGLDDAVMDQLSRGEP